MTTPRKQLAEEELLYLDGLLSHPGWALFVRMCEQAQQQSYAALSDIGTNEPVAVGKHIGAHKAIGDLTSWPLRHAEYLRAYLTHQDQPLQDD